jgi:hypothetical protein
MRGDVTPHICMDSQHVARWTFVKLRAFRQAEEVFALVISLTIPRE